jgi:hypothetical protein
LELHVIALDNSDIDYARGLMPSQVGERDPGVLLVVHRRSEERRIVIGTNRLAFVASRGSHIPVAPAKKYCPPQNRSYPAPD